ncbi:MULTISPECIES: hypothetical protein [unclassified Pseudoxanthomonas]|uniref:hypothetical protein n=1 Tax=unclassified Pseudoxanthomonas TaxID=2645906 RepID=UPI003076CA41
MNALPESLKDHRVRTDPQRSVTYGDVAWEPVRSLWFIAMTLGAVVGGALNSSWSGIALFLVSTAAVLLFGHSLGMPSRRTPLLQGRQPVFL